MEAETTKEGKVKAKDENKSKKKKEKASVCLNMDDVEEVIFGCGLTKEDVKGIWFPMKMLRRHVTRFF